MSNILGAHDNFRHTCYGRSIILSGSGDFKRHHSDHHVFCFCHRASGKKLKIETAPTGDDIFDPPRGGFIWLSTAVSWDDPAWTGGTGYPGALAGVGTYKKVAESDANATSLTTSGLKFTLAANPSINKAGNHTLSARWRFSSF